MHETTLHLRIMFVCTLKSDEKLLKTYFREVTLFDILEENKLTRSDSVLLSHLLLRFWLCIDLRQISVNQLL